MARNAATYRLTIVLALALVALLVPASAYAGTGSASVDGAGKLTYTAAAGDANRVVAAAWGSTVTLTDTGSGVAISPGAGCSGRPTAVTCSGVTALALNLSGGNNFADSSAVALPTTMESGAGVDRFYSGSGSGNLNTGDGDDWLDGGLGEDTLNGGPGANDVVVYTSHSSAVNVSLDGVRNDGPAGETDSLNAVEHIIGGSGDDTLTGNSGQNYISGGLGNDTIDGGPGADLLYGGAGDDVFAARDGALDGLSCGTGTDSGLADADDTVEADCESVEKSSAAAPPGGSTTSTTDSTTTDDPVDGDTSTTTDSAPKDGLTGPINLEPPVVPAQTAPVSAKGVARVAIECPADAGSCRGTVVLRLIGRRRAKERATVVAARRRPARKIGRARFRAEAGTKPIVRVRLNKRGRRRVLRNRRRRAGRCRARVVVRTRTADGRVTRTSRTIRLRARRAARGKKRG